MDYDGSAEAWMYDRRNPEMMIIMPACFFDICVLEDPKDKRKAFDAFSSSSLGYQFDRYRDLLTDLAFSKFPDYSEFRELLVTNRNLFGEDYLNLTDLRDNQIGSIFERVRFERELGRRERETGLPLSFMMSGEFDD